jgi:hypothetical protein
VPIRSPIQEKKMSDLLKSIDARTKLAGTNKLEILMFSLGMDMRSGREETFGINVQGARGDAYPSDHACSRDA